MTSILLSRMVFYAIITANKNNILSRMHKKKSDLILQDLGVTTIYKATTFTADNVNKGLNSSCHIWNHGPIRCNLIICLSYTPYRPWRYNFFFSAVTAKSCRIRSDFFLCIRLNMRYLLYFLKDNNSGTCTNFYI